MLRTATRAFVATAALCLPSLASAQEVVYSRPGCYLGLGGVVAFPVSAEDALEDATGSSASVDESLGLLARGGCRGSFAAGELHFEWLDGFDAEAAGTSFDISAWALSLDAKLYPLAFVENRLPALARRFQPFATLGFGYLSFDAAPLSDDWDFIGRFGGGLDVYLTKHIALTIDTTYVLPTTDDLEDLDYVSVGWGLSYQF
jgi:hypothetical protein